MFHMETHPTDQPAVAAELLPVSLQQLVTDRLLGLCHLETILNPPNLIAITGWSADPSESLIGLAEELCAQVLRALGTTVTVGVGRACRNFMELPGSRRDSLAAVEYKALQGKAGPITTGICKAWSGSPLTGTGGGRNGSSLPSNMEPRSRLTRLWRSL